MPARRRLTLLVVLVLTMTGPMLAPLVSAQGTPEADRYVRETQGYAGEFVDVLNTLDAFWLQVFRDAGAAYRSPSVTPLVDPIRTACGPAGPQDFAFYCPGDEGIYYSPVQFTVHASRIGDFAVVVVMAHEWGHHVQTLLSLERKADNTYELQADCFAGAYAQRAGQLGLLDPGDITEAVMGSAEAGDPLGLPQDVPGAHGINDDRVTAFMRGYLDGAHGCGWTATPTATATTVMATVPVSATATAVPTVGPPVSSPILLATLLPSTLVLPQGQPMRQESNGSSSFTDMLSSFREDEALTRQRLTTWGWEENVFRIYASDSPPPNAAGWVVLGIHRFATVEGAAEALPAFAESSRRQLGYTPVDVGLFADQTEAFSGQAYNGNELVIYARRGNLVFRASGISPNGDPSADVFETILIPLRQLVDEPRVVSPALFQLLPSEQQVGPGMTLTETHARSAGTIATTFPNLAEAERLFRTWGWRESAAHVFSGRMASGTTRLEISVFRLANEQMAAEALPYFLNARATALQLSPRLAPRLRADAALAIAGTVPGGQEATVYIRRGPDLYRVSAISDGDPMADLAALFQDW